MMARIRQYMAKEDKGFTLIELLVVMIIIGILAAIAIPIFLSQREKAEDAAAKADVATIGKGIATWYIDTSDSPVLDGAGAQYLITNPNPDIVLGNKSPNVVLGTGSFTNASTWCVTVTNPEGDVAVTGYEYDSVTGLGAGNCT